MFSGGMDIIIGGCFWRSMSQQLLNDNVN